MKKTKKLILTSLLIAVGVVLPIFARMIGAGQWLSPLHIPALLGGILLGPLEGLLIGFVTPLLNNVLFSMPPAGPVLLSMCVELPVYGIVSGVCMRVFQKQKNPMVRVYLSLILAMLAGRVAGGIVQACILGLANYSIAMWGADYFVGTAPGIVVHLSVIPIIYLSLLKAKLLQ